MSTERKRGAFGDKEMAKIRELAKRGQSISDIAKKMNRTQSKIQDVLEREHITHSGQDEYEQSSTHLRKELHKKDYWKITKQKFTSEELAYFESGWINLVLQFKEDVKYSEELSINQLMTQEILMDRMLIKTKRHEQEAENLNKQILSEMSKTPEVRDTQLIAALETQRTHAETSAGYCNTSYNKFLTEHGKTNKLLKATREDRIKKIEDSTSTFVGYLKILENERTRQEIGDEVELHKLAKDKALKDLSEWHSYADKKLDLPILNCDTVKNEDENEDESEDLEDDND